MTNTLLRTGPCVEQSSCKILRGYHALFLSNRAGNIVMVIPMCHSQVRKSLLSRIKDYCMCFVMENTL